MDKIIKCVRAYATIGNIDLKHVLKEVTPDKFNKKFSRSSGPGGQNVNKLNTKVELRLKLSEASWLPEPIRSQLEVKEKNTINKDGELVVTSEQNRTQYENLENCLDKIRKMITVAAYVPDPPSKEALKRVAANIRIANERRLMDKKYHSQKKRDRKDF